MNIIDVVNEFKGIIPNQIVGKKNWTFYFMENEPVNGFRFNDVFVCSFKQFDQCVNDCITNKG